MSVSVSQSVAVDTATAVAASSASALVDRAAFLRAATIADKIIESRNKIPVLSNFLIRGHSGGLRVTATDLDIQVSINVPGASDDFATTAPADNILKLLKSAKASDMVALDARGLGADEKPRLNLDFAGLNVSLIGLPAADMPDVSPPENDRRFKVQLVDLARALEKTAFAISTEETRYYLNGIYLHVVGESLVFASTDGHRLSRYTIPAPEGCEGMPGVLIPRKLVNYLSWVMARKDVRSVESIGVQVSENRVSFIVGDVVIVSKVIDGTFPDYARVIPQYNAKRATFDASELSEAVKQVSLISSERGRAIKFEPVADGFTLSVLNSDVGHATMTVRADMDGIDFPTIGFNSRYVLDILANVGDVATIAMNDAGSLALITDPSDDALTMVLMPMRV